MDSYYGPDIHAWLEQEAAKDPNKLARPGTIVRVIVEKAFAKRRKKGGGAGGSGGECVVMVKP